jgi:hypothetical protein
MYVTPPIGGYVKLSVSNSGLHALFQNPRTTPSGRKLTGSYKRKREGIVINCTEK